MPIFRGAPPTHPTQWRKQLRWCRKHETTENSGGFRPGLWLSSNCMVYGHVIEILQTNLRSCAGNDTNFVAAKKQNYINSLGTPRLAKGNTSKMCASFTGLPQKQNRQGSLDRSSCWLLGISSRVPMLCYWTCYVQLSPEGITPRDTRFSPSHTGVLAMINRYFPREWCKKYTKMGRPICAFNETMSHVLSAMGCLRYSRCANSFHVVFYMLMHSGNSCSISPQQPNKKKHFLFSTIKWKLTDF